jgi:taurine dioxygenase
MQAMAQLSVEQITPAVGAIIRGADLSQPQLSDDIAFMRQALLDHGVIFFEGQQITTEQHWHFDRYFGAPMSEESSGSTQDTAANVMHADLAPVRHSTAVWHADTTSLARPPWGTTLRPIQLPDVGGEPALAGDAGWADGGAFGRSLDGADEGFRADLSRALCRRA